jgi:hypothetical protein
MGKSISEQEYGKARTQLEGCKDAGCSNNKQAKVPSEDRDYCKICKLANKVRREYERVKRQQA